MKISIKKVRDFQPYLLLGGDQMCPQALISIYKFRTTIGEARYRLGWIQQPKALRNDFVLAFGQIRVETRISFQLNWLNLNATKPKEFWPKTPRGAKTQG
jgi:hypothetical protein